MKFFRWKHRLAISVIFVLTIFSYVIAQTIAPFPDVPSGQTQAAAILFLKNKGIVKGYPDDKKPQSEWLFWPNRKINRVEALKIITAGLASKQIDPNETVDAKNLGLSDLQDKAWYLPYLKQATEKKVVAGYPDGTFKPAQSINLAEALKIILLMKNVDLMNKTTPAPYVDVPKDAWFTPYVIYAKEKYLIEPAGDGKLYPGKSLSRADLSEIIYRLMYIEEKKVENFDMTTNWPTYEKAAYFTKFKYPPEFIIKEEAPRVIVWKKDPTVSEFDYFRNYPNSAAVTLSLLTNTDQLSGEAYFSQLAKVFSSSATVTELRLADLPAMRIFKAGMIDTHIYLPNKQIVVFYGNYGQGDAGDFSKERIMAVENSFVYLPNGGVDTEKILEEARKNILVDGQGKATLDLFPDEKLIETDSIGVGTGPVDYYYSEVTNVTLKYERSFNVVLAMKEGETTGF